MIPVFFTSCYYQPAECLICNCLVELNELKNHLRLECGTEWLEYCEQETSSSVDFLSFLKQINDGFRINLKDLCRNFVLIIDEIQNAADLCQTESKSSRRIFPHNQIILKKGQDFIK